MSSRLFMSSGNMMADRRFDYARDLQLSGDLVAAADLFEQATDLAPGFAAAWFTLGDLRERLGDRDGAIVAFRNAERTDTGDRNGAGLRLMRLGATALATMPATYVTAVFDQYAPKFDAALTNDLGYRGPALLCAAVLAARAAARQPAHFKRAIDLGCGTGLAARAFAANVDEFIGIDLSPQMIERARATGFYAQLEIADIVAGLGGQPEASADLVIAADVMLYLHDLLPVLVEIARVSTPAGLLAMTTETHDGDGVVLGRGLRFAHSETCVRGAIAAVGFTLISCERTSVRTEGGVPVPGLVVIATRP